MDAVDAIGRGLKLDDLPGAVKLTSNLADNDCRWNYTSVEHYLPLESLYPRLVLYF